MYRWFQHWADVVRLFWRRPRRDELPCSYHRWDLLAARPQCSGLFILWESTGHNFSGCDMRRIVFVIIADLTYLYASPGRSQRRIPEP